MEVKLTAQELIDEFELRLRQIRDADEESKFCIVMAITKVNEDYGLPQDNEPLATLIGGHVSFRHRVYGDMVCAIASEISKATRYGTRGEEDREGRITDILDRIFGADANGSHDN